LKIGVDARPLSRPLTGIGRYTLEMCKSLSKIDNISLYLYSPSPIDFENLENITYIKYRTKNWHNGFLKQLWAEFFLPKWAKEDKIDVFWGPVHRLPRFLPKTIASVITIHDLVWKYAGDTMHSFTYFLEKFQMPSAIKAADFIVTDSQSTFDAVKLEFGVESKRLALIPLAAVFIQNNISFEELKKYNINLSYFLFVGTLEPRKNLARLLEAYSLLPKKLKLQTMLVIVGGKGWGNVDLENIIAQLNLGDYVKVLGYVDEQSLTALYAHAKFLAMPSIYEGFGLPLLEAMTQGTPVLTSNNSSMPEVAGNAGLLIAAQDVNSIKEGLFQLLSNDELLASFALNTKTQARKFNWDKSAVQLFNVFNKAINLHRS